MSQPAYIGYIRVSTKDQADSGLSLDAQEDKIRSYAKLFDLELSHIEVDAGLSGRKMDRPGLQRALDALETGEAAGLIIAKLDRMSRSVAHTAQIISRYFGSCERHLLSVTDHLNTTTANGRMVINILATMAQWEAEVISERTKTALDELQKQDVKLGATCYGSVRTSHLGDNGRRVIEQCADESSIIKDILRYESEGHSLRSICQLLESAGVRTKKGKTNWHPQTVKQIIQRAAQSEGRFRP